MSLSPDGQELRVARAEVDDTGAYECHAFNIAGERTRHFEVDVYGE